MHKKTVVDFKELGQRLIFENPLIELSAKSVKDVKTILQEVENYQKQGYYVIGYVSYEAAKAFDEKFLVKSFPLSAEYLAYFTVHQEVKKEPFPCQSQKNIQLPKSWQSKTTKGDYEKAIARIKEEIRQGNTYQVNYTLQLSSQLEEDALTLYNHLVIAQEAAYNCYIEHDDFAILSVSPELFFLKKGNRIITRPMKGTITRGYRTKEDLQNKIWLANDSKNRAENMMIVDLLRNDMGRISEIGSVKVTKLCEVEQYSTVWQMTSTIESQLQSDKSLLDIFSALFPCGSITGAPKIATMAIINQLEKQPRGVYCGTIGICLPNGDAIFNVGIRTIQKLGNQAIYGAGGGITWGSVCEDEYKEVCDKAAVLYRNQPDFDILTTARVSHKQVVDLDEHIKRLKESARYFAYPFSKEEFLAKLSKQLEELDDADYRLRILVKQTGAIQFQLAELRELPENYLKAELVHGSESIDSPFTYFKTTYRPHLQSLSGESIFISNKGYLQETTIGNLILEIDGKWYTPSVDVGILDGICRQKLIKEGRVFEAYLTKDDLKKASHIYACNSVRGVYEITLKK
ncbi:anthranilate/para-aminobenzoate synthase [Streptococcus infantarius subsp. infantarius]|nr:anthranilate/para-aminobenzoate synthase [Streptococcus infantarius subsp. infantarius]MCO4540685.1 anthranilate/para-aminobenzoate synthase [Streptococcus infantarius subsp. infantarius]MCO4568268.1 anthranilate/para-aminobenzoate synthase [Streptococcus infantarius subsp. infantarius]